MYCPCRGSESSVLSTMSDGGTTCNSVPRVYVPSGHHGHWIHMPRSHTDTDIQFLKNIKLSVVAYIFNIPDDQIWFIQRVPGQWGLLSVALSQKRGKKSIIKKIRRYCVSGGTVKKNKKNHNTVVNWAVCVWPHLKRVISSSLVPLAALTLVLRAWTQFLSQKKLLSKHWKVRSLFRKL